MARSRAVALWAGAGLAGVLAFAVLHAVPPPPASAAPFCLARRLLGIPCPGCGMTRALAHLAKGEWRAALALHPLAPLLVAEAVVGWLAAGLALGRGGIGGMGGRGTSWVSPVLGTDALLFIALWAGRLASGTWPR